MQLGELKNCNVFDKLSNFPRIPLQLFPKTENCEHLRFPLPVPLFVFFFNIRPDFPPTTAGMPVVGAARDPLVVDSRSVKNEPDEGGKTGQGVSSASHGKTYTFFDYNYHRNCKLELFYV